MIVDDLRYFTLNDLVGRINSSFVTEADKIEAEAEFYRRMQIDLDNIESIQPIS